MLGFVETKLVPTADSVLVELLEEKLAWFAEGWASESAASKAEIAALLCERLSLK